MPERHLQGKFIVGLTECQDPIELLTVTLEELDGGRLAAWLKEQRKAGMSPSTSNAYLTALKGFGNWLVKDRRLPESPFAHLSRVNQNVDVRIERRALSEAELARLIAAAESGKPFRSLSGPDRAMLYLVAAFTGLRASELHSLAERSLNLRAEPPTVKVEAAYSKHREEDVLPLHPELAGSGVHPKLAKELARHSTITLTMDRYAHVGLVDMNAALDGIPSRHRQTAERDRNREGDRNLRFFSCTDSCNGTNRYREFSGVVRRFIGNENSRMQLIPASCCCGLTAVVA